MIHRFVDLLSEIEGQDMIWNITRVTGGTTRTFAIGQGGSSPLAHYLSLPQVATLSFSINYPDMSPDLQSYVYVRSDTSVPVNEPRELRAAPTSDSGTVATIALSPVGGTAGGGIGGVLIPVGWSPDSQQVYYLTTDNLTDDDQEFRRVDADGTNDTLILATAIPDFASGILPRISPDGSMIAYWVDSDSPANQGLWVMNADGSGNGRIYTATSASFPNDFYGWSRDSEWLVFVDTTTSSPFVRNVYKIRPDGTDQTTLYSANLTAGEGNIHLSMGQYSVWTDDSSAVVAKLDLFPAASTEPSHEIGLITADGSETWTALSPQRLMHNEGGAENPTTGPVMNRDASRVYWQANTGLAAQQIVSTKVDGTDYRIDDDHTDSSTVPQHDDYLFVGFATRSAL